MPRTRNDDVTVLLDEPEPGGPGAGALTTATAPADVRTTADRLITFLETGEPPEGLFAPGLFLDFTMPTWRLQALGVGDAVALRHAGHPATGRVPRSRLDPTPTGFVLEVEETWAAGGDIWYCRELLRADVGPAGITALSVYCTGDWDSARVAEHARLVELIRP